MTRRRLLVLAIPLVVPVFASALTVTEVDGSSDSRIFRVGVLTPVLLEPVRWKLVDSEVIRLDESVTSVLKSPLPPEYAGYSLCDLLEGETPLPDDFPLASDETPKDSLLRGLWSVRTRVGLAFGEKRSSAVAIALFWLAVSERLGLTLDQLCERYLCEPYALRDTSFTPLSSRRSRMVLPPDASIGLGLPQLCTLGLLSSPRDVLRIAYVVRPHLSRFKTPLTRESLLCGHTIKYISGDSVSHAFLGFNLQSKQILLRLSTSDPVDLPDLLATFDSLEPLSR